MTETEQDLEAAMTVTPDGGSVQRQAAGRATAAPPPSAWPPPVAARPLSVAAPA